MKEQPHSQFNLNQANLNFLEMNQANFNIYVDAEQGSSARLRLKLPPRASHDQAQRTDGRQTEKLLARKLNYNEYDALKSKHTKGTSDADLNYLYFNVQKPKEDRRASLVPSLMKPSRKVAATGAPTRSSLK